MPLRAKWGKNGLAHFNDGKIKAAVAKWQPVKKGHNERAMGFTEAEALAYILISHLSIWSNNKKALKAQTRLDCSFIKVAKVA